MSEIVPTTEDVKFAYIDRRGFVSFLQSDYEVTDESSSEEFDRWFANVIRLAKAEAWSEGYISGHSRAMRRMSDEPNVDPGVNPYEVINNDELGQ